MSASPRAVGLSMAAAVVGLDQLTKSLVVAHIGAADEVHIVGSLRLIRRFNTGMAFSKGSGSPAVSWIVGIVIVVLAAWVLRTLWRPPGSPGAPSVGYAGALGALLGGALGNKVDRLIRRGGAVVDFIDVGFWPVFNVADSALSLACVALVVFSLRSERRERTNAQPS
jgi:signal peptidase II